MADLAIGNVGRIWACGIGQHGEVGTPAETNRHSGPRFVGAPETTTPRHRLRFQILDDLLEHGKGRRRDRDDKPAVVLPGVLPCPSVEDEVVGQADVEDTTCSWTGCFHFARLFAALAGP
jgi:hypothetical protein